MARPRPSRATPQAALLSPNQRHHPPGPQWPARPPPPPGRLCSPPASQAAPPPPRLPGSERPAGRRRGALRQPTHCPPLAAEPNEPLTGSLGPLQPLLLSPRSLHARCPTRALQCTARQLPCPWPLAPLPTWAGWKGGAAAAKTSTTWSTLATAGSESSLRRGSTPSTIPAQAGQASFGLGKLDEAQSQGTLLAAAAAPGQVRLFRRAVRWDGREKTRHSAPVLPRGAGALASPEASTHEDARCPPPVRWLTHPARRPSRCPRRARCPPRARSAGGSPAAITQPASSPRLAVRGYAG